jgi:uncharacterized repeat protein (TIGR03847 family)
MGRVEWIGAEALGLPGQRTFRLMILSDDLSAHVWLEKEQLQLLAQTIARLLVEIASERGDSPGSELSSPTLPKPSGFPENPEVDFHAGKLSLGYDADQDLIALEAYEPEAEEGDPAVLLCLVTRRQMEALQASSMEIIAAGRPRCPLCGTPLSATGMPHFCPSSNGHQKLTPEDDIQQDEAP